MAQVYLFFLLAGHKVGFIAPWGVNILGGQKMDLFTTHGAIKSILCPASRKIHFSNTSTEIVVFQAHFEEWKLWISGEWRKLIKVARKRRGTSLKSYSNINFTRLVVTFALLEHQTSHSQNKFFFPSCTIYYLLLSYLLPIVL